MRHKKNTKSDSLNPSYKSVQEEMMQPRMARSAKIEALNLDTERVSKNPSTTMAGTVKKIIPSSKTNCPEEAQITLEVIGNHHQNFSIENTLVNEHGDDVRLKKGAHVDVTVTATDV
jgi:hypothetical protein